MCSGAKRQNNYDMVKKENYRCYHRHLLEVDVEGQIAGLSLPQITGIWVSPIWDTIYLHDFGTHR
jgi:hypothetical protein